MQAHPHQLLKEYWRACSLYAAAFPFVVSSFSSPRSSSVSRTMYFLFLFMPLYLRLLVLPSLDEDPYQKIHLLA
jgi:hypothetical protein